MKSPPRPAFRAAVLAGALCLAGAAQAATLTEQVAEARTPGEHGALLYREQHLLRSEGAQPRERLVVYRCPGGAAFARKRIDYTASAQAPAFALEDRRSGYAEGMRRAAGGRVELYFRADAAAPERRGALPAPPMVADAGFDEFIRARWAGLLAGEAQPLQFAVPARLRTMQFEVQRIGSGHVDGEDAQRFRLRLGGWLGLVAPHIDVAYGAQTRRLLRFEGLGNLRDPGAGRQLEVRIDFPKPALPAAEARWQAAAAETLVGSCGSGQQADS
jgi:hypothetical protein